MKDERRDERRGKHKDDMIFECGLDCSEHPNLHQSRFWDCGRRLREDKIGERTKDNPRAQTTVSEQ